MVGFVEDSDELAFGFLDPSLVIRGCHLIPRFASGRTNALMSYQGPTVARAPGCTEDWTNFYVNMHVPLIFRGFFRADGVPSFVDRDMFMRYYGGGVGHGDSAADVGVAADLEEVIYEGPVDPIKFEDVEEESDDTGNDTDDPSDPAESSDEEAAGVY